jgi:hypothetical protein
MISIENRVVKNPNVAWRVIKGEAYIVTPWDSTLHTFNKVATRIWELADGTRKVSEIITQLEEEFEVDCKRVKKDTLEFINSLLKEKILTKKP